MEVEMDEIRVPWTAANVLALSMVLPVAERSAKDKFFEAWANVFVTAEEFIATDRYCALSCAHSVEGIEAKKWDEIDHSLEGVLVPVQVVRELVKLKIDVSEPMTVVFGERISLINTVGDVEGYWETSKNVGHYPPVGSLFGKFEFGVIEAVGFSATNLETLGKVLAKLKSSTAIVKFQFSGLMSSKRDVYGATLVTISEAIGFSALLQPAALSTY